MNTFKKLIVAAFVGLLFCGSAFAQADAPEQQACAKAPTAKAMNFTATKSCFIPSTGTFVVIDSADNAVDILQYSEEGIVRVGRDTADIFIRRYDVKDILRPVSVQVVDDKVVYLATSANDSSCLVILDMQGNRLADYGLNCHSNAFAVTPCGGKLVVMGFNPQGYDINTFDAHQGLENMTRIEGESTDYHVFRQSEKIQQSDPVGIGLTVVAVSVVFLALLCVAVIIFGYSGLIKRVQDKKSAKTAIAQGQTPNAMAQPSTTAGDVYAAIAAAIHLYNEELHDEEDTIITIQKVERAWTPWNAKFYNMNQYNPKRK